MRDKMLFVNSNDIIKKIKDKDTVQQTRLLTQYYCFIRFNLKDYEFDRAYVDGPSDGGLDFIHKPDELSYYILQSKFTAAPKRISFKDIKNEITKIFKTILLDNPNKKAVEFVNAIRRDLKNPDTIITINWLTTNLINDKIVYDLQDLIESLRNKHDVLATIDFIPVDKDAIDRAIYDKNHNFVPQTGRKELPLNQSEFIKMYDQTTSINSVICKVKITDLLKWFKDSEDIKKYLQKNVRGFIGGEDSDKTINSRIAASFKNDPKFFWYKHNGIIIFVDSFRTIGNKLVLINPQIVNGGQTISTIYNVWDKNRISNDAEVLLRIYRQSYDDSETYVRTIDIVSALNSQNKVKPSDLKSNDHVQVKIEQSLSNYHYEYLRKREKYAKSGNYKIKMVDLAKLFHCCLSKRPDIAIRSNVEAIFEDKKVYKSIFDIKELDKPENNNHRIIQYITVWNVSRKKDNLHINTKIDRSYLQYSQYFLFADIFNKLWDWKLANFTKNIETWIGFLQSDNFSYVIKQYSKDVIKLFRELKPSDIDAHDFYRSREAVDLFFKKSKKIKISRIVNNELNIYLRNFAE